MRIAAELESTPSSADPYAARLMLGLAVLASEGVYLYFVGDRGVSFVLSSLLVTVALLIQLKWGMRASAPTCADLIVFVFNWLFLDLAPQIQLISEPARLVNTSTVSAPQVFFTNGLCALFIVTFTIAYHLMSRRAVWVDVAAQDSRATNPAPVSGFGVTIAAAACFAAFVIGARYIFISAMDEVTPTVMIFKNFVLLLPTATFLILLHETVRTPSKRVFTRYMVLGFLFLLVLFTENPYSEKRYALGPIYLTAVLILFEAQLRQQNRRLVVLVLGMVLAFPAISLYTHSYRWFTNVKVEDFVTTIEDHYLETHYDAWANIYTTTEIVSKSGPELGKQLLGSTLFFVPSSVWKEKPHPTGFVIGDYLMTNYAMWFRNLSAPLIAEGYIDFGIPGVLVYAVALALIVCGIHRLALVRRGWIAVPLATYLSLYLMYLLRGALMPALAYGAGHTFAFLAAWILVSFGRQVGEVRDGSGAPDDRGQLSRRQRAVEPA